MWPGACSKKFRNSIHRKYSITSFDTALSLLPRLKLGGELHSFFGFSKTGTWPVRVPIGKADATKVASLQFVKETWACSLVFDKTQGRLRLNTEPHF